MSQNVTLDRVVSCLTSPEIAGEHVGGAVWRADTLDLAGGGVFGGELVGQAIAVAARLDPEMPVRSISAYFPRAVRDTGSLDLLATTLHRGNAYATQRVDVVQPDRNGQPVTAFSSTVLCHRPAEGIEHQAPMPAHAGSPDDARPVDLGLIPWETRFAGTTDLSDRAAQANELLMWTRVNTEMADDLVIHQVLLAYLSDLTLIGTALLPHAGWSQLDAHVTIRTSVISHQLVFHAPFRIDDWLLFSQTSPVASGGSALGVGHIYTAAGRLVASVVQESMTRVGS